MPQTTSKGSRSRDLVSAGSELLSPPADKGLAVNIVIELKGLKGWVVWSFMKKWKACPFLSVLKVEKRSLEPGF